MYNFLFENCVKYGLGPFPALDPEPKLFQNRNRNRNKLLRFHNISTNDHFLTSNLFLHPYLNSYEQRAILRWHTIICYV
jgi:hypothetical protein